MPNQFDSNEHAGNPEEDTWADTVSKDDLNGQEWERNELTEEREISNLLAPLCPGGVTPEDQLRIKIIINLARLESLSTLDEKGLPERDGAGACDTSSMQDLPILVPPGPPSSPAAPGRN